MARGGRGAPMSIVSTCHSSFHWLNHKTNVCVLNLRHSKHNVNKSKDVLVFLSFCFRLLSLSKKTWCHNKLKMQKQKQSGFFPGVSFSPTCEVLLFCSHRYYTETPNEFNSLTSFLKRIWVKLSKSFSELKIGRFLWHLDQKFVLPLWRKFLRNGNWWMIWHWHYPWMDSLVKSANVCFTSNFAGIRE